MTHPVLNLHGHVIESTSKARCGGPGVCTQCRLEEMVVQIFQASDNTQNDCGDLLKVILEIGRELGLQEVS